ncbi:MAG TPA: hypothetical protein VMV31_13220 [Terriglobales bacterium]|nr:hypothetical protein [Terriglobales bacterium]
MACAAAPAWAQKQKPAVTTVRVRVTVLNPEGKPLRGAGVVLKQETVDAGRIPKHPFDVELHTDSKGKIVVQGFQPGIVLVQVIAHNYQTYGQAFIMKNADEAVHVKLKYPRSQVSIYH